MTSTFHRRGFPDRVGAVSDRAKGGLFGYCSRRQVEHILQPVGRLHRIVCNGIHEGNPNCLCVDVEVCAGGPIPASIPTYGGGPGPEIRVAVLPAPPPRPQRSPHKSSESAPIPLGYTPDTQAMKSLADHGSS